MARFVFHFVMTYCKADGLAGRSLLSKHTHTQTHFYTRFHNSSTPLSPRIHHSPWSGSPVNAMVGRAISDGVGAGSKSSPTPA